jgi:hypothetical protein
MNRQCNPGYPPVYPNFPTPPMPNFPVPPFTPNPVTLNAPMPIAVNSLENQVRVLQQQVDSLDRRVTRLEGMMNVGPTPFSNTSNFQMM